MQAIVERGVELDMQLRHCAHMPQLLGDAPAHKPLCSLQARHRRAALLLVAHHRDTHTSVLHVAAHGYADDRGKTDTRVLQFILDMSDLKKEVLGRIDMKEMNSWIEIEPGAAKKMIRSIDGKNYRGRKIRMNDAETGSRK